MSIYTEDLTKLITLKIKVNSGKRPVVTCPGCNKKFTVPLKMVRGFRGEDSELTCNFCQNNFLVQFEANPRSTQKLQISITDISNNNTCKNITVQQLTANQIDFFCKGQHTFRKGQKVRVNHIDGQDDLSKSKNNAIVLLVHGKYVSCRFVEALKNM